MKKNGLLGFEMELLLLNDRLEPVDAFRKVSRVIPKSELGPRGSELGLTRVVKELYPSILEINFRPFWDNEFDYFTDEVHVFLSKLWKNASEMGIYPCPISLPPRVSSEEGIRPGETCAMHFHYSWRGGFLRREERLPYYNVYSMVYLILLPSTLSSGYLLKRRAYLGDRYIMATALFPPVHIREEFYDFDYILEEMRRMSSELGTHHPYPYNPRLLDIAPLTKEEAYFLLSRKSTVEIRAFDVVPSLLIIRSLWILISAIGKFVSDNVDEFRYVDRSVFRSIWFMRNRVLKHGFNAKTITVSKSLLPQIKGEHWPRFLYEEMTVKDALLWLIDYLGEYIDMLSETSSNIIPVINKYRSFVRDGRTPAERLLEYVEKPDWHRKFIEIFEWALYDPDFVP